MNREAAQAFARVQIAMWLPAECVVCHKEYASVDDFIARNVRAGNPPVGPDGVTFVDDDCWDNYIPGEGL